MPDQARGALHPRRRGPGRRQHQRPRLLRGSAHRGDLLRSLRAEARQPRGDLRGHRLPLALRPLPEGPAEARGEAHADRRAQSPPDDLSSRAQ
eukprot:9621640-Lingulodinium_polyedra.AAC.1